MSGLHGHKWLWLRAVTEAAQADQDRGRPQMQAIHTVASLRTQAADKNGGSCYIAKSTVAATGGLKPNTVTKVDNWLEQQDLLRVVRVRPGNVTEYQLVLPDAVESDRTAARSSKPVVPSQAQPVAAHRAQPVVPEVVPVVVSPGAEDHRPETTDPPPTPTVPRDRNGKGNGDEDREPEVEQILDALGQVRLKQRSDVAKPHAWLEKVRDSDRKDFGAKILGLRSRYPDAPAEAVAAAIFDGNTSGLARRFGDTSSAESRWELKDESGVLVARPRQ